MSTSITPLLLLLLAGCLPQLAPQSTGLTDQKDTSIAKAPVPTQFKPAPGVKTQTAILAGGCFWGTEFHFRNTPGVTATAVGYIGGTLPDPTYQDVLYKNTGHAEATLVEFDPTVVTYRQILDRFWMTHNPCTPNRQGPDIGPQYRSEIFYLSEDQRQQAEASIKEAASLFKRPIVTKITKAPAFYYAEVYHQQYAEKTDKTSCPIDFTDHRNPGTL